jgi:hypothetical protein
MDKITSAFRSTCSKDRQCNPLMQCPYNHTGAALGKSKTQKRKRTTAGKFGVSRKRTQTAATNSGVSTRLCAFCPETTLFKLPP